MSSEFDMSTTIAPKSDQLNADDLVAGSIVVKILDVKRSSDETHPFWFHLEGYKGRPWKPCKTQRRLIVQLWGPDVRQYVGRSVELFRDPRVIYGGVKVGGIRVQALSDIEKEQWVVVTESEKKRTQHLVKKLDVSAAPAVAPKPPTDLPPGDVEAACQALRNAADKQSREHLLAGLRTKFKWTKQDGAKITATMTELSAPHVTNITEQEDEP